MIDNDLSYLSGVSDTPLSYETIGQALDRVADRAPHAEALVVCDQAIRWSWGDLRERVDRLACALLALGMQPGDRLAIWSPNCAEWVLVQLATARVGIILVTINPAYRTEELRYALELVECRALVLAGSFKTSDYLAMLLEIAPQFREASELGNAFGPGGLEHVIQIGEPSCPALLSFTKLCEGEPDRARLEAVARSVQPEDAVNIQFTSGTTGSPKGATLTHHNILNNAAAVGRVMRIGPQDRICIPVPLYHCFGMVMGVLNAIVHGATMVFPGRSFEAGSTLAAVAAEKCTALYGVPTMFVAMLTDPAFVTCDCATLRTGIMAGAPCPPDIMRRVMDQMHMKEVTICYGMTETSPVSFQTRGNASVEARVKTVGSILPHIEAKLVDTRGRVVPQGEVGEILVRGYSVMKGYWGDPEKTREVKDEAGWMHTGDLGVFDPDGHCRIVGRSKDMIIRGGENIYPAEIENFLFQHPDIIEAAVFGIPDKHYGEQVCAWLRVARDMREEEVLSYCRGKIAHFKVC